MYIVEGEEGSVASPDTCHCQCTCSGLACRLTSSLQRSCAAKARVLSRSNNDFMGIHGQKHSAGRCQQLQSRCRGWQQSKQSAILALTAQILLCLDLIRQVFNIQLPVKETMMSSARQRTARPAVSWQNKNCELWSNHFSSSEHAQFCCFSCLLRWTSSAGERGERSCF